jgi:hypothetical protein
MRPRVAIPAFLMAVVTGCAWQLMTTVFITPNTRAAGVLLFLGCVFAAWAASGAVRIERVDLRLLIAVPVLLVAGIFLPWPHSLAVWAIAVGLLASPLVQRLPIATGVPAGAVLFGEALLVQAVVLWPTLDLMGRVHALDWLSTAVAGLLRFFGTEAAAAADKLTVLTVRETHEFWMSPEMLGFPAAILVLVAGLVALCFLGRRRGRPVLLLLMVLAWAAYVVLRAALMLLVFLQLQLYVPYMDETVRMDTFWSPWWTLASFVPLAFVWAGLARLVEAGERKTIFSTFSLRAEGLSFAAAVAGGALLLFSMGWHDAGTPRGGRVFIDEGHSGWEKSTRPLDTEWYGSPSMYNMFSLSDYLDHFFHVTRNTKPLTRDTLAGCDVLILKVPTYRYADNEIRDIVEWVRGGGGLYMIGEHSNYVGSAVALNSIARYFDIRVHEDCIFNLTDAEKPEKERKPYSEVWHRPEMLYHPVVANNPWLRFEVSCSVSSDSPGTAAAMLKGGLYRLYADYYIQNYYPFPKVKSSMQFGPFMQMAARDFGRGRVVVFTDSTTISNFAAFYPGFAERDLSVINWLNRTHAAWPWRPLCAVLGLLLLIGSIVALYRGADRTGGMALAISGAVAAGVLTLLATRAMMQRDFALPKPHTRPVHVGFVQQNCSYELPTRDFVAQPERSYDIFYEWVLRVRDFPRVREKLADAMNDDLIVLIDPCFIFRTEDIALLRKYLEGGGRILVLLRTKPAPAVAGNPIDQLAGQVASFRRQLDIAAAKSLLNPFGLDFAPGPDFKWGPLSDAEGKAAGFVTDAVAVTGGKPLYRIGDGVVASSVDVGKGKLVVAGFGDCFSDVRMGVTYATVPDNDVRARFELEYALLRMLAPSRTP